MNTPNDRKSARIASAQEVLKGYSLVRVRLTDDEKPHFDKAVALMEDLSETTETNKLLALDAAIVVALLTVNASSSVCSVILSGLTSLVHKVAMLSLLVGGPRGRSDSN